MAMRARRERNEKQQEYEEAFEAREGRREERQAGRPEDRREDRPEGQREQPGTGPAGQERLETETNPTWGHWLGRYGEQAAARYLAAAGYRLLDRNWVCRDPDLRGELDLVARYRRTVVACEVKTRAGDTLDHPAEAVTAQKAQRLRLLAVRWIAEQRTNAGGGGGGAAGGFGAGFAGAAAGRSRSAQFGYGQIPVTRAGSAPSAGGGPGLRIDVIAVRTDPTPPFAVRSLDHLIGVA